MVFPDPKEKAVLTIRGQDYSEWETVQVKHALRETPYFTFRMTCSEGVPIASNLRTLQIIPGDDCTITLAGQPAFSGLVCTRQAFYDAKKHYIEIQGASNVLILSYGSVVHRSYEFNNKSVKDICTELCKPYGIKFVEEGGLLPSTPIPRYNIAPGTTVHDAIEPLLRAAGDVQLTSNLQGDLVAAVNSTGAQGTVREGVDILEGRELIYNPSIAKGIIPIGQGLQTDENWGPAVLQMHDNNSGTSSIQQPIQQVIILEIPAFTKQLLTHRGNMDRNFQKRDQVTVFVTRQGWLRPDGGLWQSNKDVSVVSPMLIMNGSEKLIAKSVTFTQDNSTGTRTVLELCNPLGLGQGIPQAPPP